MQFEELQEYKEVKKFLAGKANSTKTQYLGALKIYTRYRDMNPEQLIDEIEEDRKKPRRKRGEVEYILKEFHSWLLNEKKKQKPGKDEPTGEIGVSPKRAHTIIGALRSFYKANGFPTTLNLPRPTILKKNYKIQLRAEDVKKLVDHAPTLRDKAIILMLFQSGMDVSTLCSLDYGDVARGLEKGECPLPIRIVREKENVEYTTFMAKDGIEALQAYLHKRRQRKGDIQHDNPLFIKERVYNGKERMSRNLIEKVMREIAAMSGVVSEGEMERADFNPCRPHALRSAFATIMKLQGVNNEIVEYWLGHSIPYESAYFIPPQDELKRIYGENAEPLSINRAVEQIKKLEEKYNGKMDTYDDIIERQASKIKRLESQIAEMEQSKEQQAGEVFVRALENPDIRDKFISALVDKAAEKDTSLVDAIQQKQNK